MQKGGKRVHKYPNIDTIKVEEYSLIFLKKQWNLAHSTEERWRNITLNKAWSKDQSSTFAIR